MCGIVGYVGKRNAKDVIMQGLSRLEYRGYDSAGIALRGSEESDEVVLNKAQGRLTVLQEQIEPLDLNGPMAIGHTRWATHGIPSDSNAHPHKFGRVLVVHNGIIENYLEQKRKLLAKGHSFLSATDSEVVAHLMQDLLDEGLVPLEALLRLCEQLEGAFALGFMLDGDRDRLYFAKRGVPLVVAKNDDECFFASDQAALVDFQPHFYSLNDYELGFIERDRIGIFNENGQAIDIALQPLVAKLESIEKLGHPHFMHKEIFEQPETVRRVLAGRIKDGEIFLEGFELDFSRIAKAERLEIVGCGSAYIAGCIAKPALEELLRLPVSVEVASEYRYRTTLTDEKSLAIAISQSGETADTLAALQKAMQQGAPALSVCNVVGSAIANTCQSSIGNLFLHAGPEIAVASTKAFIATIVALKLLALAVAKSRGLLAPSQERALVRAMLDLPSQIDEILLHDERIQAVAKELVDAPRMLYLGRGELFPVALEGALKMKELSYIFAEGYPAGELKHGPIATIDPGMPAVVLFGHGVLAVKTASNLQEIKARGAKIISITPEAMEEVKAESDVIFDLRSQEPFFTPVLATIPLQMLAYHLSVHKGLDPDKPRNLAKSVTVE